MIRKLTAAEIADQHLGAVRLGPGVWRDRHGDLHFSIVELLAASGLEDTAEHRAAVMRILDDLIAEQGAAAIRQEPIE